LLTTVYIILNYYSYFYNELKHGNRYLNTATMSHFVKLTTVTEGGYLFSWVDQDAIKQLTQTSGAQAESNEGTCEFEDGTIIPVVGFNETLQTLA